MSWLSDLAAYLKPPAAGASERHVTGWRWAIVIAVLVLIGNAAGGRGLIPFIPAYAQAADVKVLLELQYAEVIRGLQEEVCKARGQSRQTLEHTLEDYQRRYTELTGRRYPVKPCRDETI